ncbi:serine/threonine-protein kinase [Yinghuangia sp. YIM S10712]|uniref:serine/threonine-protein kinase n=1 Tax=Yinghuangia sp. YIM S10712 TaxID=3436930 RepID=UPI003F532C81
MTALPRRVRRPAPGVGSVLAGRYRLRELLGAGGTADVFRGLDMRLRRDVAVKVFRPGACAVTAERFCQEAELLGRVAHPGLVAVHDVGRHETSVYIVMRLVEGVTLREHILDGPLSAERVARLGARLASALEHVHAAGIVHRDVKPSNVLVGLDDAPYLADFGISRLVDEPTRSAPDTIVGTVPYLAPEQLLGRGSGPASDIHALGLVLLEALKGEREYPGGPLGAGTARTLRPPHITARVPVELASVIEAMTRTDPADRPDAAECVRMLTAAAGVLASGAGVLASGTTTDADIVTSRTPAGDRDHPPLPVAPGTGAAQPKRRRPLAASLVIGIVLGAGGTTAAVLDNGTGSDAGSDRPAPAIVPTPPPTQPGTSPAPTIHPTPEPLTTPVDAVTRTVSPTSPAPTPPGKPDTGEDGDNRQRDDSAKGQGKAKEKSKAGNKPEKPAK